MIKGLITFTLVTLVNIFYVYYLNSVKEDKPLVASLWSSGINLALSVSAIFYVQNHWIIVPSCLGSFVGTYIGAIMNKKVDK
jgi:hypothetical protein